MNKIYLIGNVVHTPEVRTTQSGVNVCRFSLAVKRKFKNPQTGDYETDFFDVQAWRQLADLCSKYLEKGKRVAVVGSMQSRDYEGKDGGKRRAWEVTADEVEFLSPKSESQGEAPAAKPKPRKPEPEFTTVTEDEPLPF